MKKRILSSLIPVVFSSLITANTFASSIFPVAAIKLYAQCTPNPSVPTDTVANFCTVFPESVISCSPLKPAQGEPIDHFMQRLYNLMMQVYGSVTSACDHQSSSNGSTPAACISQWNCYWHGGTSSDPAEAGQCSS